MVQLFRKYKASAELTSKLLAKPNDQGEALQTGNDIADDTFFDIGEADFANQYILNDTLVDKSVTREYIGANSVEIQPIADIASASIASSVIKTATDMSFVESLISADDAKSSISQSTGNLISADPQTHAGSVKKFNYNECKSMLFKKYHFKKFNSGIARGYLYPSILRPPVVEWNEAISYLVSN